MQVGGIHISVARDAPRGGGHIEFLEGIGRLAFLIFIYRRIKFYVGLLLPPTRAVTVPEHLKKITSRKTRPVKRDLRRGTGRIRCCGTCSPSWSNAIQKCVNGVKKVLCVIVLSVSWTPKGLQFRQIAANQAGSGDADLIFLSNWKLFGDLQGGTRKRFPGAIDCRSG